jgi:hypothetical protein
MSYPASLTTLSSFPALSCHAAARPQVAPAPPAWRTPAPPPAHPSQLLEWLRLAARQVFGTELTARIEPYRACRRCVSQVRWCGEGLPAHPETAPGLQDVGITPITPSLVIGAKADPYPPAEAARLRTRGLLLQLARPVRSLRSPSENGTGHSLEISILTRSPLLLRDLDLLVDLDQRHALTVGVLIPAADPKLARRLESTWAVPQPPAPTSSSPSPASPAARFELIRALAAHGIATEVVCTPIQPGVNNGVAVLRRLFDLAHQAGARDVRPAPRHPALPPSSAESRQLLALFRRLRLERGFPRTLPGRG